MAREFQFWFLQLFSNILWASTRWIIPLNGFWISPVEKKSSISDTFKKCLCWQETFRFLFLDPSRHSWLQSFLRAAEWIPKALASWAQGGLSSRQQSDWWQHSSSCQLSPEHSRKAPHVRFRTTESSCSSTLMRLWQQNNFQNVLRPRAPLK